MRGKRGRPRQRPDVVLADRGYDHDKYRNLVRELQIRPLIARRGTEHGSGLGKQRWVVEQTFALMHAFRRLRIRREVRADIHEAFLKLARAHLLATPVLIALAVLSAGKTVGASTLCEALDPNKPVRLPTLKVVTAFIHGCGGSEEDVAVWTTAWRRMDGQGHPQRQATARRQPATGRLAKIMKGAVRDGPRPFSGPAEIPSPTARGGPVGAAAYNGIMDTLGVVLTARSNRGLKSEEFDRQVAMLKPFMDWDAPSWTWWARIPGSRTEHVTKVINTLFEAARLYGTAVTVQLAPAERADEAAAGG
ncbi:transposase [Nonomuraea terrae]|uniref:transposase n=1 Tax=Nonomuraea terrae TaxID=2530383 RepID=UPI0026CB3040